MGGGAGLGTLAPSGFAEHRPPAVVATDTPHGAVTRCLSGLAGLVGEEPVAELGVIRVGVDQFVRQVGVVEVAVGDAAPAWKPEPLLSSKTDVAAARNERLARQAEAAIHLYGDRPVIAAGSTGSIPATANLLAAIADLPRGAEDYYLGFSGAPSVELWLPNRRTALFYAIGGGAGYINAKGVPGGQGQKFTLNWFTQFGLRHQLSQRTAVAGSAYFVHHSNLGMTDPNPGIDALGLSLGLIWNFD